ncbi:hypothetical protein BDZ45DRAFT_667621 [Acephala macrosclerotiorum]|nr:hypothetical protein BDZ45DRAFT_667621 [Acephala macrosclerotiorum]
MYAEFTKLYPDVVVNASASRIATTASRDLEARGPHNKAALLCYPVAGQNWIGAEIVHIQEGITYLNNFNGVYDVGGGPRNVRPLLSLPFLLYFHSRFPKVGTGLRRALGFPAPGTSPSSSARQRIRDLAELRLHRFLCPGYDQ